MLKTMFLPLLRIYRLLPRYYIVLPLREKPHCCLMQLPANKSRVLTSSTKFYLQKTMYTCSHILYQQLRVSQCYLMRERPTRPKALMSVSKSCPLIFIVITRGKVKCEITNLMLMCICHLHLKLPKDSYLSYLKQCLSIQQKVPMSVPSKCCLLGSCYLVMYLRE